MFLKHSATVNLNSQSCCEPQTLYITMYVLTLCVIYRAGTDTGTEHVCTVYQSIPESLLQLPLRVSNVTASPYEACSSMRDGRSFTASQGELGIEPNDQQSFEYLPVHVRHFLFYLESSPRQLCPYPTALCPHCFPRSPSTVTCSAVRHVNTFL